MRASAEEPPLVGLDDEPDELLGAVSPELDEDEVLELLESEPDVPGM